jgi:hypothetical protein
VGNPANDATVEGSPLDGAVRGAEAVRHRIASNAAVHGSGLEDVRVGRADGRFVGEIVDPGGGFDDATAGYLAPRPGLGAAAGGWPVS